MLEETEGKCLGYWELRDGENAFADGSKGAHRLLTMKRQWLKYEVEICDELGYVPISKTEGE